MSEDNLRRSLDAVVSELGMLRYTIATRLGIDAAADDAAILAEITRLRSCEVVRRVLDAERERDEALAALDALTADPLGAAAIRLAEVLDANDHEVGVCGTVFGAAEDAALDAYRAAKAAKETA